MILQSKHNSIVSHKKKAYKTIVLRLDVKDHHYMRPFYLKAVFLGLVTL